MTDQNDATNSNGDDSTTTEWFGQNVASDAELAEQLVAEHGAEEAEERFDEQATGEDIENKRRGDSIDPELGEAAYRVATPERAADVARD